MDSSDDNDSLFIPGNTPDPRLLAALFANKDKVSGNSSDAAPEVEGATYRLQIDQTEQEQRLYSQESIQAHLRVVDREKYSKIPKFPAAKKKDNKPSQNDPILRFTSNIRSELSTKNPGARVFLKNLA